MSPPKTALLFSTLTLLGACQSQRAGAGDVPARLTGTEAGRAELQNKVSAALSDVPVLLARDALTRDSLLVIERNPPRDLRQPPLNGRDLQRPVTFRLLLNGGRCWLERLGDGERWELVEATCAPAPDSRR